MLRGTPKPKPINWDAILSGPSDTRPPESFRRRARRWLAALLPLALVLGAAFLAASPLLHAGYYEGHDGIAHLFRVAVLAADIANGIWYPRWSPDLAQGFGYPVFAFYGPASHYLAVLLHALGMAFPEAVKATYGLAVLGAAFGMYRFARSAIEPAGRWGAALAAAAYALAPYLLDDIYARGALGEAVAFVTFPPLFLGIWRIAKGHGAAGVALAAISAAAAVVTYNPLALFALPFAVLYALWLIGVRPKLAFAALALVLGLGVSAWFWLPALIDTRVVTIGNLGYARENFLALGQLLQTTPQYHHELFPYSVGLVQAIAAVAGCAALLRLPAGWRREVAFFPLAALVTLALISAPLAPLWDVVPFFTLIAYPWRLLAFVALFAAMPTGCLVRVVPSAFRVLPALTVALLLAWASVSATLPQPILVNARDITPEGWQRRERELGIVGTTSGSEYLPRWSNEGPGAADKVARDEGAGSITAATLESVDGLNVTVAVTANQPTTLRLHSFYFPGWQVRVNGTAVDTGPQTELGLVSARVPAGANTVAFAFGDTAEVLAGNVLALISLAVLLGGVFWLARRRPSALPALMLIPLLGLSIPRAGGIPQQTIPVGREVAPGIILLGATVRPEADDVQLRLYWLATRPTDSCERIVLRLLNPMGDEAARREAPPRYGLEPTATWRANEVIADPVRFRLPDARVGGDYRLQLSLAGRPGQVELGTIPLRFRDVPDPPPLLADFGGQIGLQAARLTSVTRPNTPIAVGNGFQPARPAEEISLDLVWRALRVPEHDYVFFAQLFGADGKRWLQIDRRPGSGISALTTWQPGEQLPDHYQGVLPLDIPPGEYRLEVGFYAPDSGDRLIVDDSEATTYLAARLVVLPVVAAPSQPIGVTFGNGLELVGYDLPPSRDVLRLVWRTDHTPSTSYKVFVHMLNDAGNLVGQVDDLPGGGRFPTDAWPADRLIEDLRPLPSEPAATLLEIGLYDPQTGDRLQTPNGAAIKIPLR